MICYSESMKQQSKGIKHTYQHQDKEQKETITTNTSRLRIYSYGNWQTASQGRKDQDRTYR